MTLVQKGDTWGVDVLGHMVAQQLDGKKLTPIPPLTYWFAALLIVAFAAYTGLQQHQHEPAGRARGAASWRRSSARPSCSPMPGLTLMACPPLAG
jgi:hypothetical protein